jgi:hypothetical protein
MIFTFSANLVLDLLMLFAYYLCSSSGVSCQNNKETFGFSTPGRFFFTMSAVLTLCYTMMVFIYLPVLSKIMRMLSKAYPVLYKDVKVKLIVFLFIYEIFLSFRAFNFYMFEFTDEVSSRWMEINCYISEIFMISIVSYIGLKNSESEDVSGN